MNILFFLTPKIEVEYVYEDFTVRQIMEKMNRYKYGVLPVLKENGEYLTSVSEGDILRFVLECDFDKDVAEMKKFKELKLYRPYKALAIDATVKDLYEAASNQNFIPIVDDRNMFIGIVRRKAIIENIITNYQECEQKSDKKVTDINHKRTNDLLSFN